MNRFKLFFEIAKCYEINCMYNIYFSHEKALNKLKYINITTQFADELNLRVKH